MMGYPLTKMHVHSKQALVKSQPLTAALISVVNHRMHLGGLRQRPWTTTRIAFSQTVGGNCEVPQGRSG